MSRVKFTEGNLPLRVRVSVQYIQPSHVVGMPKDMKRMTIATLIDRSTNELLAKAVSVCNNRDNDNRKIGRAIAVGRAYKVWFNKAVPKTGMFTPSELAEAELLSVGMR